MKLRNFNRRQFLLGAAFASPGLLWADASWVEPDWVKIERIRLTKDKPTHRIVHFTDIHHKGDRAYLESVVQKINACSPDAVCFTGDLIEKARFLPETLEILGQIKAPLYGVPGNHDYWSHAKFDEIRKCFARGGGSWLMDSQVTTADGKICFTGATCLKGKPKAFPPKDGCKNIMLLHYPLLAEKLSHPFDLILAGHSHGGQVRIPFYGALMVPYWVGKYEMGMFQIKSGPLYVNPGIGYIGVSVRFNCRPEITVFEV